MLALSLASLLGAESLLSVRMVAPIDALGGIVLLNLSYACFWRKSWQCRDICIWRRVRAFNGFLWPGYAPHTAS
jgi:hypothetical protein